MPVQTRHWCFTLNNYTADEDDSLRAIIASGLYTDYGVLGYEQGEGGTPHIQGYVVFCTKKRMQEAKNILGQRCHLEAKRGSSQQAADYCRKDGLYVEHGALPAGPGRKSLVDEFKVWIMQHYEDHGVAPTMRDVAASSFHSLLLQRRNLSDYITAVLPQPRLMEGEQGLKPWQEALAETLEIDPPDDRMILFYVDEAGGQGKSWFQRYFVSKYPDVTQVLGVGKRDDIAHSIDESKRVFLFNVPRGGMEFMQYTILEQLKDRMVFSPKYGSRMKILNHNPHVVVFCNEEPDMSKMTADRYIIERFEREEEEEDTVDLTVV